MKTESTILRASDAIVAEPAVGAELGSYKLVSVVGQGAMGAVYKARHTLLGREVAIKFLKPEYATRPDVVQRFFREARVVNEINHEHIVEVTDFVADATGVAYLVMELLNGRSLRAVVEGKRGKHWPRVAASVKVMAQVCQALHAAHERGVVHRDLKPDNIFLINRGGSENYVKVLDFGVAKLSEPIEGDKNHTVEGMILGTPVYMSPEQASGQEVERATDVWSAGVVLYELLCGDVPYDAPTFVDLALRIRSEEPRALPERTPGKERIPPGLTAVVMKCLEKKPSDRYRSMAALAEALAPFARKGARGQAAGSGHRLIGWGLAAAVAAVLWLGPGRTWKIVGEHLGLAPQLNQAAAVSTPVKEGGPAPAAIPAPEETAEKPGPAEEKVAAVSPEDDGEGKGEEGDGNESDDEEPVRATPPAALPMANAFNEAHAPVLAIQKGFEWQAPTHVEVELYSRPAGATVTRRDTGQVVGKTPLSLKLKRRKGDLIFRFTLSRYEDMSAAVDMSTGGMANVAMRPRVAGVVKKAPAKKKALRSTRKSTRRR
jgi:serine/threonine-protein kinase